MLKCKVYTKFHIIFSSLNTGTFKYYRSRMEPHGAAWSRMEPPYKLQILQEPHGDPLDAWSRMERAYKLQILQEPHQICKEPHGATV